jgi:tetraacyldisaccharide 4'-kinase
MIRMPMLRTPDFWRKRPNSGLGPGWRGLSWQAVLLAPFGVIYGAIAARRMARPGWQAGIPVISIGNFTAGGAGKTPTALAIAVHLKARGENPVFVSRGHGGSEAGPHRVDLARDNASSVGDEPLLLARSAPTIVAHNRAAGARLAIAQGASCILLDDALQHPSLAKDVSIAVVDGGAGFGNGLCLPAGPLRAPLSHQIAHVDLILLVGEDTSGAGATLDNLEFAPRPPVLRGRIEPSPEIDLESQRVFAFSGIARPEKFEATLTGLGAVLAGRRHFADHHPFSESEARTLLADAAKIDARLVTTEKDHVRLHGGEACRTLARMSLARMTTVVPIRLAAEPAFFELIDQAVLAARSRAMITPGPA